MHLAVAQVIGYKSTVVTPRTSYVPSTALTFILDESAHSIRLVLRRGPLRDLNCLLRKVLNNLIRKEDLIKRRKVIFYFSYFGG